MHRKFDRSRKKLPATTKTKPLTEQVIPKSKPPVLTTDFSIAEVVEQTRRNGFDVVEVLKQYFSIDEIPVGEII